MVLNKGDKAIIEALFEKKDWLGVLIVRKFPSKNWKRCTVNRFIEKLTNLAHLTERKAWTTTNHNNTNKV